MAIRTSVFRRLLLKGGLMGVVAGSIAYAIFLGIDKLTYWLKNGEGPDLKLLGLLVLIGVLFTSVPSFVGGALLEVLIYRDATNNENVTRKGFLKGTLVGAIAGMSLSGLYLILINFRSDLGIFLLQTLEVVALASLAGGWVGRVLAKDVSIQKPPV